MSRTEEWHSIKSGTRRIRRVCGGMLPPRRGVACLARVQRFEANLNRIVKGSDRAYRKNID